MANAQELIYGVNLPTNLAALRAQFLPALAANGSQTTAANSAIFYALVTELSSISRWMFSDDIGAFDVAGRANPIDALQVYLPYEPTFYKAIAELQILRVDTALLELLREHFDTRAPLQTVAAVCIAVLYGVQAVSTSP